MAPGRPLPEPREPDTQRDQLWRDVARRIAVRINIMLGGRATRAEIEDLHLEALCRLTESDIEPALDPLLERGYVIVKSLVRSHFRRHRNRWLEFRADVDVASEPIAELDDQQERALECLRLRLRGDPLARRIFEQMLLGEDRPRHLAADLRVPVEDVYAAKRRLWRHVEAVREQVGKKRRRG